MSWYEAENVWQYSVFLVKLLFYRFTFFFETDIGEIAVFVVCPLPPYRCIMQKRNDGINNRVIVRTPAIRKRRKSSMMAMMMTISITLLRMERSGWTVMKSTL